MTTDYIAEAVSLGAAVCHLGIQSMPPGYTLLRDSDGYYTWIEDATGRESVICWDRWTVRRWAIADAEAQL